MIYKMAHSYEEAELIKKELKRRGVENKDISIVLEIDEALAEQEIDVESLGETGTSEKEAPKGTISAFGATFSVLSALATGVLLVGLGPVAALAGGATMAASGVALFLSGIGVPREKHRDYKKLLDDGNVIVAVDGEKYPNLSKQHI